MRQFFAKMKQRAAHLNAALEQLVYSGANFISAIAIAALLGAAEFGLFAALYAGVMLGSILHSAYIGEPVLVFGGRFGVNTSAFRRVVLHALRFWVLVGAAIFVLTYAANVYLSFSNSSVYPATMLSLAWCGYGAFWSTKYVLYLHRLSSLLVAMSALYGAIMLAGLFVVNQLSGLTAFTAVGTAGVAALVSSGIVFWRFYQNISHITDSNIKTVEDLTGRWFAYGHWASVAGSANWALNNALLIVLPLLGFAEQGGVLRLGITLLMPVQQLINAVSVYSMPTVSKCVEGNSGKLLVELHKWILIAAMVSLAIPVATLAFMPWLDKLLDDTTYSDLADVSLVLALLPPLWAANACYRVFFKAHEKVHVLAVAYLVATLIICCTPFTFYYIEVLRASSIGITLANGLVTLVLLVASWKTTYDPSGKSISHA